jgi:hypothetical protein
MDILPDHEHQHRASVHLSLSNNPTANFQRISENWGEATRLMAGSYSSDTLGHTPSNLFDGSSDAGFHACFGGDNSAEAQHQLLSLKDRGLEEWDEFLMDLPQGKWATGGFREYSGGSRKFAEG